METKLHREIGDRLADQFRMIAARPGIGLLHIGIELGKDLVIRRQVFLVLRNLVQTRATHFPEHQNRIMTQTFP